MTFPHQRCSAFSPFLLLVLSSLIVDVSGCSDPDPPPADAGMDADSNLDSDPDDDSSDTGTAIDTDVPPDDSDLFDSSDIDSSLDADSLDADPPIDEPLLEALCALIQGCHDELGPAFATVDDCQEHFALFYRCQRDPDAVNAEAMESCLSWLQTVGCDDDSLSSGCVALANPLLCADPLQQWALRGAPGCGFIYDAASLLGTSCESLPCAEGLYCLRGPTSAICPVCQQFAGEGESCLDNQFSPSHKPCDVRLTCSDDRLCVHQLPLESTCSRDSQCASGFCRGGSCAAPLRPGEPADIFALDQCAGFYVWRDNSCAPRQSPGAPCQYDVDCLLDAVCVEGSCQERDVCALRRPGEPCVTEPRGCDEDSFCNNTADPQLCEETRPIGASCEFTEDCGDEAYCSLEEWICTAYAGTGGSCTGALLCTLDHYCDDDAGSTCTPKLIDGTTCDYNFQCLSGHCSPDSSQCAPPPPCSMP